MIGLLGTRGIRIKYNEVFFVYSIGWTTVFV
jgi:hypothetical protein